MLITYRNIIFCMVSSIFNSVCIPYTMWMHSIILWGEPSVQHHVSIPSKPHWLLIYCYWTDCVFKISGSTTLRELHIGWNKIGDDGISLISEELQQNNSLTKLIVRDCGYQWRVKNWQCYYCLNVHTITPVNFVTYLISIAWIPCLSYCYDHYRCYYSK